MGLKTYSDEAQELLWPDALTPRPQLLPTPASILTQQNDCIFCSPLCMNSATLWKSDAVKPLEVNAGVPSLTPEGFRADLSPGHVFLFAVIEICSSVYSTLDPVNLRGLKLTNRRWVSVPPKHKSGICTHGWRLPYLQPQICVEKIFAPFK